MLLDERAQQLASRRVDLALKRRRVVGGALGVDAPARVVSARARAQIAVACKSPMMKFGPPLPEHGIFYDAKLLRAWLLTKAAAGGGGGTRARAR